MIGRVLAFTVAFGTCLSAELTAEEWQQEGQLRVALSIEHPAFMAPVMVSQSLELVQRRDQQGEIALEALGYEQSYDHYQRDQRRLETAPLTPEQLAEEGRLVANKTVAAGWFQPLEDMLGAELDRYGPRSAFSLSERLGQGDAANERMAAVIAAMIDNLNGSSDWIVDKQDAEPCYAICAFTTREGPRPETGRLSLPALFGAELEDLLTQLRESTAAAADMSEQYDVSLIASWDEKHLNSFNLKLRLDGRWTWDVDEGEVVITLRVHEILASKDH